MTIICYFCKKLNSCQFNLERHTETHHMDIRYPCPRCEKVYRRKADLNSHAAEAHSLMILWRLKLPAHAIYARDLILLDDRGVLLEGPYPRWHNRTHRRNAATSTGDLNMATPKKHDLPVRNNRNQAMTNETSTITPSI